MKRIFAALCAFLTFAAAHATTPGVVQAPAQYQFVTPQNGVAAPLGQLTAQNALPALPPCLVGDSITDAGNKFNQYFYTASGGTGPYTFSVSGLPSGISTTTASPVLEFTEGIYTAGTYPITVTVNDSASHTGTFSYSLFAPLWGDLIFTPTTSSPGVFTFALSAVSYQLNDRGPASWVNFESGGAIKIPKSSIFAHPGDLVTDVLARMPQLLAAAPQCGSYVVMIGTNSLSLPLSTLENYIWNPASPQTSIVGQLLTKRPVYLQTLLPRYLGVSTTESELMATNRWIRSLAGTVPNLRIADGSQAYGNPLDPVGAPRTYTVAIGGLFGTGPYTYSASGLTGALSCLSLNSTTGILTSSCTSAATSNSTGVSSVTFTATDSLSATGSQKWIVNVNPSQSQPISIAPQGSVTGTIGITTYWDYSYDGLHPKSAGAYAAFSPLASALTAAAPAYNQASTSYLDYYDATNNPKGNLILVNGGQIAFMLGTGTVAGRVSGVAPDGWSAYSVDNGCSPCGYTGVAAASTLADGTPAVSLTLGGTAAGGFATQVSLQYNTSSLPPFTTGDNLVASCRVEVSGASHITDPFIELVYTAGQVTYYETGGSFSGANPNVSDPSPQGVSFSGLLSTPWPDNPNAPVKTFPTMTGSMSGLMQLTVGVPITNATSGAVAGVVKIGGCSINHG